MLLCFIKADLKYLGYICYMKAAFTYDYVCLPPGRQIERHSHHAWELAYVICGAGSRTVGDETEPMAEGEVILIPPGIPHEWNFDSSTVDIDGNIINIAVFFAPSVLDGMKLIFPESKPAVDRLKSLAGAIAYAGEIRERISGLLWSMRDISQEARLPMMIELIMMAANTAGCRTVGTNCNLGKSERRMERIRVFCSCNYSRDITLDEIAAYAGMNKSAFCTFMRRHCGKSFSEYVNGYRLEKALERLRHTDDNIAEIAYDIGFANVTYFNRLFKSRFGVTPRTMRKNNEN